MAPPEQVLVVDEWLGEVAAPWDALETSGVAGCCGMDAFDFAPEAVRRAMAPE